MFKANYPVYNKKLEEWSSQGDRNIDQVLRDVVGAGAVELIRLLSQENRSFKLEGENSSEEEAHQLIDYHQEGETTYIKDVLFTEGVVRSVPV